VLPIMEREGMLNPADLIPYSTGASFRRQAPYDPELAAILARGDLVPDPKTFATVKKDISDMVQAGTFDPQRNCFVLDGAVRTPEQAVLYQPIFDIEGVFFFDVAQYGNPKPELERRAAERFKNAQDLCAELYLCGNEPRADQLPRDDDKPGIISDRYDVFDAKTMPVLHAYERLGYRIYKIDARQTPDRVAHDFYAGLKHALAKKAPAAQGSKGGRAGALAGVYA
jgi:adenylate kinase family enzyme